MRRRKPKAPLHGRIFDRRSRAATEGRHLPSLRELLAAMPFFLGRIEADMAEFGERILTGVPKESGSGLEQAARRLTMSPEAAELTEIAVLLKAADLPKGLEGMQCALRCLFYAASLGDGQAMREIATEAIFTAHDDARDDEETSILCAQALGWLLLARAMPSLETTINGEPWTESYHPRKLVDGIGERMTRSIRRAFGRTTPADKPPPSDPPGMARAEETASQDRETEQDGVVVVRSIGNRDTNEGYRVQGGFQPYCGLALPLVATPDVRAVASELAAAFPHAAALVDSVLTELAPRPHVELRPLVLDGAPGAGKTLFAERLFRALGVPSTTYPCGGAADSSLAGTARRWSSGEPSLALSLVLSQRCANPGIVLDELEKAGTSRHDGNLHDALLPFLEKATAQRLEDPYLQAPVDLSHVNWIATTNQAGRLPAPLRDRFRILAFPAPTLEHLPLLAASLLREAARERGLDARWAGPPSGEELEALAEVWQGGSVRRLQRLVEGVLTARDRMAEVH